MEFGSKYVYCYADSDEEGVSDEEFSTGITDDRYIIIIIHFMHSL